MYKITLRSTIQSGHQHQFLLNVLVRAVADFIAVSYILPQKLNRNAYRHISELSLQELLDTVPPDIRRNVWFMHNSVSGHLVLSARNYLEIAYTGRWI
jgi:hypothetical protein